jgi:hypothetical protein
MDGFRQFEYLEDFELFVCKSHGYAVRNVKRHLEEQHVETKTVNKAATARLTRLEIHDPRAVEIPATPMAPFASLSPPTLRHQPAESTDVELGGQDRNVDARVVPAGR